MKRATIALVVLVGLAMIAGAQTRERRAWLYVKDALSNGPIARAAVAVSCDEFVVSGVTDRHGRFLFNVPVGAYDVTITASASGYGDGTAYDRLVVTRNSVPQLAIELLPSLATP